MEGGESVSVSGEVKLTISSGVCMDVTHICLFFKKADSLNEPVTSNNYGCINVTNYDLMSCTNGK